MHKEIRLLKTVYWLGQFSRHKRMQLFIYCIQVTATALAKFIAHLVNQQVAHELLALQLLTVLLEEPTDDSVEIAVNFIKEVGQILEELSPKV